MVAVVLVHSGVVHVGRVVRQGLQGPVGHVRVVHGRWRVLHRVRMYPVVILQKANARSPSGHGAASRRPAGVVLLGARQVQDAWTSARCDGTLSRTTPRPLDTMSGLSRETKATGFDQKHQILNFCPHVCRFWSQPEVSGRDMVSS